MSMLWQSKNIPDTAKWNTVAQTFSGTKSGGVFRVLWNIWDKIFKNGPSKTCERQPLKNI